MERIKATGFMIDFSKDKCLYIELAPSLWKRIFVIVDDMNASILRFLNEAGVDVKVKDAWSRPGARFQLVAVAIPKTTYQLEGFKTAIERLYKKALVCGWKDDQGFMDTVIDLKSMSMGGFRTMYIEGIEG